MTYGDSTDHARDQADARDDEPVDAAIGWMAFLRAPHIPIAAWEND